MSTKLIQFNSGEHVIGNKNVVESLVCDDDIVFNESYIVVGARLKGNDIYATYDLTVLGDVYANKLSVNGDLFVKGNINVAELICHGMLICSGEIKADSMTLEAFSVAGSIVGDTLYANDDLFLQTTIDTGKVFETEGLVVAGEGILGDGSFKAKAAIANEYFEFGGRKESSVFEISEMAFTKADPQIVEKPVVIRCSEKDVKKTTNCFSKAFEDSLIEWGKLEEDEFVEHIREITQNMPDLHMLDRVLDRVITISYKREVDNFCDYLFMLCAKNEFPDGLKQYETIEPVLSGMYDDAFLKVEQMDYKANDIETFAISLLILQKYSGQLPMSMEKSADKVFSSIGIRYSTVEHVWRNSING